MNLDAQSDSEEITKGPDFKSGFTRIPNDAYFTIDTWATWAVLPFLPKPKPKKVLWEPACGMGHMSEVYMEAGYNVRSTDIKDHGYAFHYATEDFLKAGPRVDVNIIASNFPFTEPGRAGGELAHACIKHALDLMMARKYQPTGFVAALLRKDFDSAANRRAIFGDNKHHMAKIELLKRPVWIEGTTNGGRHNYTWHIWSAKHDGPCTTHYVHPDDLN
ncbi:hypothetical protein COB52_00005 [Candidatus Kaiserbacteria bacterium]|nr:MAG: hypothetical protein COB52_00005 [Candidatus Kaiserbacteria bacterium]